MDFSKCIYNAWLEFKKIPYTEILQSLYWWLKVFFKTVVYKPLHETYGTFSKQ